MNSGCLEVAADARDVVALHNSLAMDPRASVVYNADPPRRSEAGKTIDNFRNHTGTFRGVGTASA